MNAQTLLVSIIAGATSFVLMIAGGKGALPLLIVAPLPIFIASLGWGTYTGGLAALIGGVCFFIFAQPTSAMIYLAGVGLSAAYLGHLAGLSRQNDLDGSEEWFPMGDILFRAAIIGGLIFGIGFIVSNFDTEEMSKAALIALDASIQPLDPATQTAFKEALAFQVRLLPYVVPGVWLLMIWLNLWLAAKLVKMSDRLSRPSLSLRDTDLPFVSFLILGAGVVVSLLTPPVSHAGAAMTGALGMALVVMGFVTLHVVTLKNSLRGFILGTLYASIIFLGFPIFIMAGLGLADLFLKIRQRFLLANPL